MSEDNRPVNLKAFANLPADQPVVMINLLKFNDTGGVDSYRQYGIEVGPHLKRVGGRVVYSGGNPWAVIDDERPWWDAILVVEYPSPQAFVDMVQAAITPVSPTPCVRWPSIHCSSSSSLASRTQSGIHGSR